MPTNEQILIDINTDIDQTIPDRPNAAAPTYKSAVIRALLKRMAEKMAGYAPTFFQTPNGDGARIVAYNRPGEGFLRFMANLIAGSTDFALVNLNQASRGFTFWRSKAGQVALQLCLALIEGRVGIGTTEPNQALHVEGWAKLWGLVAGGGTPVVIPMTGLGGGSAILSGRSVDQVGKITITVGSNPVPDALARITYSRTLPAEPVAVFLTPANQVSAREMSKVVLFSDSNHSLVLFSSNNGNLTPGTVYSYNYFVVI